MKGAYYNENDEEKAAWLRELIREGIVAAGEVDTRSITAVWPEDLAGFSQCHFFAGIGVWSYALRLAGWPDDRPVWTGSCPCPSFSAAGKGGGFNDPRHLWPDWARLIRKCRPATLFGEQADDAIGYGWLDLVQTDLERENYAVGKAVLGACSVGAPHIRQRLYFVAHSKAAEVLARFAEIQPGTWAHNANGLGDGRTSLRLGNADSERLGETGICTGQSRPCGNGSNNRLADPDRRGQSVCGESQTQHDGELGGDSMRRMGNSDSAASEQHSGKVPRSKAQSSSEWFGDGHKRNGHSGTGFVNGFWADADWVLRKRWNSDDWQWCPTEPRFIAMASRTAANLRHLCGENLQAEEKVDGNASLHKDGGRSLRTVREEGLQTARSPQGRESQEQRKIELADFVRLLPQTIALAELHGDTVTTEAVQALLETCGATGLVQYTPNAIEAAWRSTSDESKSRLQVCLDQGGFVMAGTFPLAAGVKNRVLKLRGYGDAIVPQVAAAFIEAAEVKTQSTG